MENVPVAMIARQSSRRRSASAMRRAVSPETLVLQRSRARRNRGTWPLFFYRAVRRRGRNASASGRKERKCYSFIIQKNRAFTAVITFTRNNKVRISETFQSLEDRSFQTTIAILNRSILRKKLDFSK